MISLQSVRIQRFKRIKDAPFDLTNMNVLIGSNNSGKSSIIQGLHFGISILQSIELSQVSIRNGAGSLNPTQLIYSPSDSTYALGLGGNLIENKEEAIEIDYNLSSGESCAVQIRKGRARNINISVTNPEVAKRLSSLERPFSIFSPGLAGIAKSEAYVSDGVLLRTLARGDANLILRNILLRLWKSENRNAFLKDLLDIFPEIELEVKFEEKTAEKIDVTIRNEQGIVPLELSGTGLLQVAQILSYIHAFSPSIIVLDEPDSHLHPNNQRLLCALLRNIAEERGIQVLLTTHSRHVVDAFNLGSSVNFLWVRNATVVKAEPDDEIGVLLDIGALDIKERVHADTTKVVVLTEDENTRNLEILLKSNGFNMDSTVMLPYFGCTTVKNLRPLVRMIDSSKSGVKIILHRDSDYLTDEEAEAWKIKVRALHVEPFLTNGTDIESGFINAAHLSELNPSISHDDFEEMIASVSAMNQNDFVERYVNGRIEIARKNQTYGNLNVGQLATEAPTKIAEYPSRYRHGKTLLSKLRGEFQERYSANLTVIQSTSHLHNDTLFSIASKVFRGLVRPLSS